MAEVKKIAVTGAAGQIGYSLLFRIASGQVYGADTKVHLSMLEIPQAEMALKGVAMELEDCAFSSLDSWSLHTDAARCFEDVDCAFLVGARPRGPGMERKDLLEANAQIFSVQGKAIAQTAKADTKILVVGNPANTNALITQRNAEGMDPENFTAMTRLDQNRAYAQVADHCNVHNSKVSNVVIWGNHSATQYPDISHATVDGKPATDVVDDDWYKNTMIESVQKRGAKVIEARGLSSAASAASSAIDHMYDWIHGTKEGQWASMGVVSQGEYGATEGIVFSYPCTCKDGKWSVVPDLEINDFSKEKIVVTNKELVEERDAIAELLP